MKYCIVVIAFILLLSVNCNKENCENCPSQYDNLQNNIFSFKSHQCYKDSILPVIHNVINSIHVYAVNKHMDYYFDQIFVQIDELKESYEECNFDEILKKDLIELLGESLVLGSSCFKDIGILFLIADTIIENPKNVANDTFAAILLAYIGKTGYSNCTVFIQFIIHMLGK